MPKPAEISNFVTEFHALWSSQRCDACGKEITRQSMWNIKLFEMTPSGGHNITKRLCKECAPDKETAASFFKGEKDD